MKSFQTKNTKNSNVMKNLFVILSFAVLCVFTSCNKEYAAQVPVSENERVFKDLRQEMVDLNQEKFGDAIDTKAKWWQYLITAVADAGVGFLSGNVGFAISASSLTWTILKDSSAAEDKEIDKSLNSKQIAMSHLLLPDSDINDGVLHNEVIMNLYEKYGEGLFDLSEKTLLEEVVAELSDITGEDPETIIPNIDEAVAELNEYTEIYSSSSTVSEYISSLKQVHPEKSLDLDILEIVFEGFQYIDVTTDNGQYAYELAELIDDSDLPEDVKEDLKSGVSIANASRRLWNEQVIIEK